MKTPTPTASLTVPATEHVHRTIWRVKLTDQLTTATLPPGAVFASAVPGQDTAGKGCINSFWLVRPCDLPQMEKRFLALVGTGEPLPEGATFLTTLATGLHLVEVPATFANL